MLGIFRKTEADINPNEQAVIVEGLFESGEQFGTGDERKAIAKLEDELRTILKSTGYEYDGHEFGEGTYTLYLYGSNADDLFKKVEPVLKASPFDRLDITKRYGMPKDIKQARVEKFTL